jgi:hypothetical protein
VRNEEEFGIPLVNIERSPLFLMFFVIVSAIISYSGYELLKNVNPWGFMVMIPAILFSFQTLWLLLNPFAVIFFDKIVIRQSFFHRKEFYFIDIKQITEGKQGKIYVTYHDGELEKLSLFGIRPLHLQHLKTEVEKLVLLSIKDNSAKF